MNFFQAQDNARRKTWQLGLMFAAAVVTLIVLTNLLLIFAFGWTGQQSGRTFSQSLQAIPADTWIWVSIGVVGVISVASAYKYLSIRGGGRCIAEALGGSLIHQNTRDLKQKRLLNIVEEMAIAAGVAVPPVYLIPESSINAFAAGFSPDDAVIGINQGTLDILSRDELQGVVAHEFSHILNGDTRINLKLIAILHGILFIGMIGYGLMRAGGMSRRNGLPLLAVGGGLLIIGYGGTFFGNMIKAAVSRQREYLADASAVQFTRNPAGIADALKKIGGYSNGSFLRNRAAEQASHMFFGAAAKKFAAGFTNLLATHPPLPKRILAIEPNWDGAYPRAEPAAAAAASSGGSRPPEAGSAALAPADPAGNNAAAAYSAVAGAADTAGYPQQVVQQVGAPDRESLQAARTLIASQPQPLSAAAHDPDEARALVYAMLIDPQHQQADKQLHYIQEHAERGVPEHVQRLLPAVHNCSRAQLITLLEMAVPALKELSRAQYKRFSNNAARLITADRRVDLFEWMLHRLLVKELYAHFEGPQRQSGHIRSIGRVADEAAKLLAIIASHSHPALDQQLAAYNAGMAELGLDQPFAKQESFDYERMNKALGKLRRLRPLRKPALLKACVAAALQDGALNDSERALLHGVAATLDCPLPAQMFHAPVSNAESSAHPG